MPSITRMMLEYDGPLPGYEHKHQQNYYLSDEASQKRIDALVRKIAADPNGPDYQRVPPRIQRLVDARREATESREAA